MNQDQTNLFAVCAHHINDEEHISEIVVSYPNSKFGVFHFPNRTGSPKIDATPKMIWHNVPVCMTVTHDGYRYVLGPSREMCGQILSRVVKFLEDENKIDSCYKASTHYIFNAVGFVKHIARGHIDQRWFVSFCDGVSFINAEFVVKGTIKATMELKRVYTVFSFDQIYNKESYSKGLDEFSKDCRSKGYIEIQKPYFKLKEDVSVAIVNWNPTYMEVEIPESFNIYDAYQSIFIPGMCYNAIPLYLERGDGICPRYCAVMDDDGMFHRLPTNILLGLTSHEQALC